MSIIESELKKRSLYPYGKKRKKKRKKSNKPYVPPDNKSFVCGKVLTAILG